LFIAIRHIICLLSQLTSSAPTPEPIIEAVPSAPVESEIQAISDEAISKTDDTDGARGEPGNIENLGG
jgi:hypothetical protein